jgi:hypothetical protein
MPCLFSSNTNLMNPQQVNSSFNRNDCLINSMNNLDLSNPFNIVASLSPASSVCSLNYYHNQITEQQELKSNYFEPLPFLNSQSQTKQINYPQLSQKHMIIKQSKSYRNQQLIFFLTLSDCSKNETTI